MNIAFIYSTDVYSTDIYFYFDTIVDLQTFMLSQLFNRLKNNVATIDQMINHLSCELIYSFQRVSNIKG